MEGESPREVKPKRAKVGEERIISCAPASTGRGTTPEARPPRAQAQGTGYRASSESSVRHVQSQEGLSAPRGADDLCQVKL